jgi:hypothetical protein
VLVLHRLHTLEHQVTYLECPTSNVSVVVAVEGLLVLGRPMECHVTYLIELVERVL